jgi:hypothetical protein
VSKVVTNEVCGLFEWLAVKKIYAPEQNASRSKSTQSPVKYDSRTKSIRNKMPPICTRVNCLHAHAKTYVLLHVSHLIQISCVHISTYTSNYSNYFASKNISTYTFNYSNNFASKHISTYTYNYSNYFAAKNTSTGR